ncbi:MAG: hypothetical protein WCR67_04975 [Bacilli bacterium]
MNKTEIRHTHQLNLLNIDFRKLFILIKLLLQDKLKISFRANFKDALIKVVTSVLLFVVITAASYGLYTLCKLLNIFSAVSFIPEMVPSIISTIVFAFSFLTLIDGLTKSLYFSRDNKVIVTLPCNGSTIFLARLIVYAIFEFIRNFTIQIPLFLGYMLISGMPVYMILWSILALVFFTIAEVLVAALISIPDYFIQLLLKKNTTVKFIVYGLLFVLLIAGVIVLLSFIPNQLDIFSNWGPYFAAIQKFLYSFKNNWSAVFAVTIFFIGNNDYSKITLFPLESIYVLLIVLAVAVVFFLIDIFLVNPIYFKLSSKSFEFEDALSYVKEKNKHRRYVNSQLMQDITNFIKNPNLFVGVFGTFVVLPIIISLLNKVFGAMMTNINGDRYVMVVNLLVILLISLNTNSTIARLYSAEGSSFKYTKVYPKKPGFLLTSRIIFPLCLGTISIIISCIIVNAFSVPKLSQYNVNGYFMIFEILGLLLIYYGHAIYSAQLDFCKVTSDFGNKNDKSKAEKSSTVFAFVIAIFLSLLYYLFVIENINSSYFVVLVFGIIYFILNALYYHYRIKLIYQGGK